MGFDRCACLLDEEEDAAALACALALRVASIAAKRAGSVRWNVDVLTRPMLWVDLRLIHPSVVPAAIDEVALLEGVDVAEPEEVAAASAVLGFSAEEPTDADALIAGLLPESLRINVRFRSGMGAAPLPLPRPALAPA